MQKQTQVWATAAAISLCLSIFPLAKGLAEEGTKVNSAENDSLTVVMRDAATQVPAHPDLTGDKVTDSMDENNLTQVKNADKKCPDPLSCATRKPRSGDTAVDGSACNSGVVCMNSGVQLCASGTGTCITVQMGGGTCSCACNPN